MHPENAIDNGDFIKILVYKFILGDRGASALLFFCGFADYITGIWSCLQGIFLFFITR